MVANVLDTLDVTNRVLKRAQYEAFEFELRDGSVLVRNGSHAEPTDHEYVVDVIDGTPARCDCPADEHYDGACKHRVAVAIRTPVLRAATDDAVALATDGGSTTKDAESDVGDDPDDCGCDALPSGFPCWPCIVKGRRSLPQ